ncbi:ABC transporter permease subunit [Thermococcus sp.]
MMWGFRLEFKQNLRTKKFWVIIGIMALLYIPSFYIMKSFFLQSGEKITNEAAMSMLISSITGMTSFFVAILALLIGATAINSEIEKGTLRIAMSKPIKRLHYIGGKFLAHILVLLIAILFSTMISIAGILYIGGSLTTQLVTDVLLLNLLLLLAMIQLVALGYIISTLIKSATTALGLALAVMFIVFMIVPSMVGFLAIKDTMNNPHTSMEEVQQIQKEYTTKYLFYDPISQVKVITGDVSTMSSSNSGRVGNIRYNGVAYAIRHNLTNLAHIIWLTALYLLVGFYRFLRMDLR